MTNLKLCNSIVYTMLQRTQLLLDREIRQELSLLSQTTDKSVSQLVREFLRDRIQEEKKKIRKTKKINPAKALLEMAKAAEEIDKKFGCSGPTDLSINHDYYLYGAPKKKIA